MNFIKLRLARESKRKVLKRVIGESEPVYVEPGPYYGIVDNVTSQTHKKQIPLCCTSLKPEPPQGEHIMEKFIWFEERLNTFTDWPHILPAEQSLAEAGFIFTGEGDTVKCVACDVRVREWESTDVPFEEHRKWSPDCTYLKMVKGVPQAGYKYELKGRLKGEISTIVTNPKIFPDLQTCKEAARKHSYDVPCCMGVFLWIYKLNSKGQIIESHDVDHMYKTEKNFVEQVKFCLNKFEK